MSKYALLIGISRYQDAEIPDLLYAHRDAEVLGRHLEQECGFETVRVLQCTEGSDTITNGDVARELGWITDRISDDDTFFFFFSGHGVERGGRPILLTSDAAVQFPELAMSVESLMESLDGLHCRDRVLVFDCCRSDSRLVKGKSREMHSEGFVRDVKARATSGNSRARTTGLMFSCSLDQCAYEWPDKEHGVFTHFLVEGLKDKAWEGGRLVFQELASYVSQRVVEWSEMRPTPQEPWVEICGASDPIVIAEGRGKKKAGVGEGVDGEIEEFTTGLVNETDLSGSPQKPVANLSAAEREKFDRAEILLGNRDYYSTIQLLKTEVHSKNPDWAKEANLLIANAYVGERDYASAKDAFSEVIILGTNDPAVWYKRAKCFWQLLDAEHCFRDMEVAIQRAEQSFESAAAGWSYRVYFGEILSSTEEYARAVKVLQPAFQLVPGDIELISLLANAYMEIGDFPNAITVLTAGIELKPGDASFWCRRGQAYHRSLQSRLALDDLQEARELQPQNKDYERLVGEVKAVVVEDDWQRGHRKYDRKEYEAALVFYSEAMELGTSDAKVWSRGGHCLVLQGQLNEALLKFKEALRLDREDELALFERAKILNGQSYFEMARKDLRRLLALQPTHPEASLLLARMDYKIGQYSYVIKRANILMTSEPQASSILAEWRYLRGKSYWYRKEYAKATDDLSKAYKLVPSTIHFRAMKKAHFKLGGVAYKTLLGVWIAAVVFLGVLVILLPDKLAETGIVCFYIASFLGALMGRIEIRPIYYFSFMQQPFWSELGIFRRLVLWTMLFYVIAPALCVSMSFIGGFDFLRAALIASAYLCTCIWVFSTGYKQLKLWAE